MNAITLFGKSALSYLDWKVVEMAREDGPRSFNPDGYLARVARIIGMYVPNGLANDRLEALRRFSVRAWYWDLIRTRDIHAIKEAGYSRAHILEILSRISMTRGFMPSIEDEGSQTSPLDRSPHCRCG